MAETGAQKAAVLLASGFDEAEVKALRERFEHAGIETVVVSTKKEEARGWRNTEWGDSLRVDESVLEADARNYDAVVIPGGLISADTLRSDSYAVDFVREAVRSGIPVAAIGHASWLLVEADAVKGRPVTSIAGIRQDLVNAGGSWKDDVVAEGGLFLGRHRDDLPRVAAAVIHSVKRAH
ncbi:DJ-1/PfpI family protein [Telmatospirillum sp. J64-1]|uniref:DJ-1/PfpI family protein n=1 Tax=Telmatospirillum sp. J64-1 TaxID=2502183 RepID=UPI00115E8B1E|nr:DJ-1/PfpI family protein [Telmatospirillum sp. J64-1]